MARSPKRNSLADAISELAPNEGPNEGRYPGTVYWRVSKPEKPTPFLYPASVIFIGQGEKRGILGDETIVYDPQHYLVVLSPLPMLCETASPVLSFGVEIDLDVLRELLADLEPNAYAETLKPMRGAFSSVFDARMETTVSRFLSYLSDERTARALGRQTLREILFHLLEGPHGIALRSLAQLHGPTGQLTRVMRHIAENYVERLPVEELAKLAHMSVPTFHQHFKSMTSTSPLQYVKGIRLTRAKQLLQAGSSARDAARNVGYESESQFSREFSRFHGIRPSDVALPNSLTVRATG